MVQTLGSLPEDEKKKHIQALQAVLTDDDKDINLDDIEVDDIETTPMAEQSKKAAQTRGTFQMPTPTKQIGPNGVMQIYTAKQGGPAYYLGNDFEKDKIQITYGGTIVKYTTSKMGNFTMYNTAGWPITYNSGSPPGRSVRINTYVIGGIRNNKTKFSWDNNPGYLFKPEGPQNTELTIYIRAHGSLGTHQSYAAKKGGREEDEIRSLAEFVWPTDTHSTPQFNWNYAHFPYVNAKVKIIKNAPKLVPEKWFGVKCIHVAATDTTAGHWELWGDTECFGPNNEILNKWDLYATYEDNGCKEYKNKPLAWKYMRDVWRIDGFKNIDFCLVSDVEIDVSGKNPPPPPPPPVDQEPTKEEDIVIAYFSKHPEKLGVFLSKLGQPKQGEQHEMTIPPVVETTAQTIADAYIKAIQSLLQLLPKDIIDQILKTVHLNTKGAEVSPQQVAQEELDDSIE